MVSIYLFKFNLSEHLLSQIFWKSLSPPNHPHPDFPAVDKLASWIPRSPEFLEVFLCRILYSECWVLANGNPCKLWFAGRVTCSLLSMSYLSRGRASGSPWFVFVCLFFLLTVRHVECIRLRATGAKSGWWHYSISSWADVSGKEAQLKCQGKPCSPGTFLPQFLLLMYSCPDTLQAW